MCVVSVSMLLYSNQKLQKYKYGGIRKQMKKTRIVVISDMHVGSIYGLAPLDDVPQNKQSPFLLWVNEKWLEFCKKYNNPDYLLLAGDLTDGSGIKNLGVDAICTNLDEQEFMACKLLKFIIGSNTKIYGVNGSGYHCGQGQATNLDRRITERLHGEFKGSVFVFDIGEEKIQVAHVASSSMINPLTGILREIRLSKEDAQKRKTKSPTIIVRGHLHRALSVQDDAGVWGILNGCWQTNTPFMLQHTANITPSIGATIIDIEDGIAKVFRVDYPIPEDVRQAMFGYEQLKERTMTLKEKKDRQEWLRLQRQLK